MTSHSALNQDEWHRHIGGDPRDMSVDDDEEDHFFKTFDSTNHRNGNPNNGHHPHTSTPLVVAPDQSSSYVVHDVGTWQGIISIPRAVTTDEQSASSPSTNHGSSHNDTTGDSSNVSCDDPSSIAYQSSLNSSSSPSASNTNNSHRSGVSIHAPDNSNSKMSSLSSSGTGRSLANAVGTSSNNITTLQQQAGVDILDGTAYFSLASPAGLDDSCSHSQRHVTSVFRRTSSLEQEPPTSAGRKQAVLNTNQYLLETSAAISMSPPSPMRSVGDIFQNTSLTPQRITIEDESECEKQGPTFTNRQTVESRLPPPQVVSIDGSSSWATTRERAPTTSSSGSRILDSIVDTSSANGRSTVNYAMPPKAGNGSINPSRGVDALGTIAHPFQQHQQGSLSILSAEAFSESELQPKHTEGPSNAVGVPELSDINTSVWSKEDSHNYAAQPEASDVDRHSQHDNDRSTLAFASLQASEAKDVQLEPTDFSSPMTRPNAMHMALQDTPTYMARIEELEAEKATVQFALVQQMQRCQELEAQIVEAANATNTTQATRSQKEELEVKLAEAQPALAEQYEMSLTTQSQLSQSGLDEEQEFMLQLNAYSPLPDSGKYGRVTRQDQHQKLLERNKTLVKEVRFADQTCVELSSKLKARESELEQLRDALERVSKEVVEANRTGAKVEVVLEQLNNANEDKRGLERQLHSAYDKIDAMAKEFQLKQEKLMMQIAELSESAKSSGSVSDETARKDETLSDMRREIQSLTTRCEQYGEAADLQQQKLNDIVSRNNDLTAKVRALSSDNVEKQQAIDTVISDKHAIEGELRKANIEMQQALDMAIYEKHKTENELRNVMEDAEEQRLMVHAISSERDRFRDKVEKLYSRHDATEQTLSETRDVLNSVTDTFHASREEKKLLAAENDHLKKELTEARRQLQEAKELFASQSLEKPAIIAHAEASERGFEKLLEEFASCFEKNLADAQASLTALTAQFDNLGDERNVVKLDSQKDYNATPVVTFNPSLLSHLLSTSSSNGAMMSPQVVQILQLMLTFSDQNLHALEVKVDKETRQYAERLSKLCFLVNHIRSSLVFEADDSSEVLSTNGGATSKQDCEDNVLNATLTAVASVPDKNVDLMEGGIGPAPSPDAAVASGRSNGDILSPVRETIQDLSMIEAVNSPFYSSELTFSLDSSASNKMLIKGGLPGGRQLFGGQLEVGRKELERLRTSLAGFQDDFWVQRKKLSAFVEAQMQTLQILGEAPSLLAAKAGSTLQVDMCGSVHTNLEKITLDLEASKRAEERATEELRQAMTQIEASNQRIAGLEKEKVDLEYRLIGDSHQREAGQQRHNAFSRVTSEEQRSQKMSFRERLDSFDSENVSGTEDGSQQSSRLRNELAEARRSKEECVHEIENLEKKLMAAKDAHDNLKLSYISCNDKLAAALESIDSHRGIAGERQVNQQKESQALLKLAEGRVEEKEGLVKKLSEEKKMMENELRENAQALQKALEDTKQTQALNRDAMQYKEQVTNEIHELQRALRQSETFLTKLKESNDAFQRSKESVAQLQIQKDAMSKEINDLQAALRHSEQAHEKLKEAYVNCNNKLAEALEQLENQESAASERNDVTDMRLRMAQDEVEALQSEMAEATKKKEAEIEHLQRALEQVKHSFVECNDKLVTTQERAADMAKQLNSLTAQKDAEIDHVKKELAELDESLEKLKVSFVECNDKLATTEEKATEMEEQRVLLQQREQQLRFDLAESNVALDKANIEREDLKQQLWCAKQAISSSQMRIRDLQNELDEVRLKTESNSDAAASLHALKRECDEMRAAMEAARQQIDIIKTEMGEDLKRAQDQLTESLQMNNELRSELVEVSKAKETCDDVLEKLKVSYLSVNDELANILERKGNEEDMIDDLKAACDAADELTRQTEDRLLDTQNVLEETRKEREELANKVKTIEAVREKISSAFNNQKTDLLEKDDLIASLKKELDLAASTSGQELASVASRLRGLRRDVIASLQAINIRLKEDDQGESDFWSEMQHWWDTLPALREAVLGVLDEQGEATRTIQQLHGEILELREAQDMLIASFSDEKLRADELGAHLREARAKLEFSASKIEKLSNAFELARGEASEERRKLTWSEAARCEEMGEMLAALSKEKDLVKVKEAEIRALESKLGTSEKELLSLRAATTEMGSKEEAIRELESQRQAWETKCFKLRTYMRKLTDKCAEWETIYSQQSKALERLQAQQGKTRRTASELARKYFELTDDVQARTELHDEERRELINEISSFQSVHQQLEAELNDIANELANVCWT